MNDIFKTFEKLKALDISPNIDTKKESEKVSKLSDFLENIRDKENKLKMYDSWGKRHDEIFKTDDHEKHVKKENKEIANLKSQYKSLRYEFIESSI